MSTPVEDQVIDFYDNLFAKAFWDAFDAEVSGRLRRKAIQRAIEASADAASQSLARFFLNQRLDNNSDIARLSSHGQDEVTIQASEPPNGDTARTATD